MTMDGTGGKYDAECELLRAVTGAQTSCAIVINGVRGTGFSLSTTDPRHVAVIVSVLRDVADQLEADARKLAT
jgi:hypothetical protein